MLHEQEQLAFDPAVPGAVAAHVRHSLRARRLSVRVHRDARVEVVVPKRTSERRIAAFIAQHRIWIERQRQRALEHAPPLTPFPPPLLALPAIGENWRVHLAGGGGAVRIRELTEGVLAIRGSGSTAELRDSLRRWLLRHGKAPLERQLQDLARQLGVEYRRLSLRLQRSRWGSCSVRGTISLNAATLFQPPKVAMYLMIHELTHLRHANHSLSFWQAVESHCPDWRELDRALLQGWRHVPAWVFA